MMPDVGLGEFNRRRFLGTLTAIVKLLQENDSQQKWIDWFQEDFDDFMSAAEQPKKAIRQMAVIEHAMSAFGGMSEFTRIELSSAEDNEKLQNLSTQLWSACRGLQADLAAEMQE